ncbi:MAG: hypothetical protein ACM30I_06690 [Gemmatimonas sp.]
MKNGHLHPEHAELLPTERTADRLGIASLALGLAESMAPKAVARGLGSARPTIVRSFGLRELAAGLGLLMGRNRPFWLWMRILGDALDLVALARVMGRSNPRRNTAATAFAAVALVTALDLYCAQALSKT